MNYNTFYLFDSFICARTVGQYYVLKYVIFLLLTLFFFGSFCLQDVQYAIETCRAAAAAAVENNATRHGTVYGIKLTPCVLFHDDENVLAQYNIA